MKDIMIDIESLGRMPNAAILSIGAVRFSLEHNTIDEGSPFYRVVKLKSAFSSGGKLDPATLLWWVNQPDDSREAIFSNEAQAGAIEMLYALNEFSDFITDQGHERNEVQIWSHKEFDIPILANAYARFNQEVPWHYRMTRDLRTLQGLYRRLGFLQEIGTDRNRPEGSHYALEDAIQQAHEAIEMYGWIAAGVDQ